MQPKLLYIGYVWPEPLSSAAGWHTTDLISAFQQMGYEGHLSAAASFTQYATTENRWAERGVRCHSIELNRSSFDTFIKDLQPEVVVFDRFVTEERFGARVFDACPQALRVVDMQDFHTLRKWRETCLEKILEASLHSSNAGALSTSSGVSPNASIEKIFVEETKADPHLLREVASLLRSDGVIAISDTEKRLLETIGVPAEKITVFSYAPKKVSSTLPSYAQRKHFLFLGNQRHAPNADAIQVLCGGLWKAIRDAIKNTSERVLPELHIWGAYELPRSVEKKAEGEGIFFKGRYEGETVELMQRYGGVLAPLRFGAGVKGKILEAWMAGTPVLTTDIGVEGLQNQSEVLPTPAAPASIALWATRAMQIYGDENCWTQELERGLLSAKMSLKVEEQTRELNKNLRKWREGRTETGGLAGLLPGLLFSQLHASNRYFSKWIEEKEKNNLTNAK